MNRRILTCQKKKNEIQVKTSFTLGQLYTCIEILDGVQFDLSEKC